MAKKTFYMTTPIYYPSNKLHIGNAYCTTAADVMCRFKKQTGHDVYFLTGTDEHGQKIERRAKETGVTPIAYVDEIVAGIKSLWKLMDIEYDDFIRTTEPRHERVVQKIFKELYDRGHIYKSEYSGWYCTPCETFFTETQAKDGKCPDCGAPVEKTQEEAYFLALSKYQDWLIEYIEKNPGFIEPQSRANEMLANFLRPGLEDLCVTRTSFTWGVPVTFDEKHVVYVWIDALSNYITALGYGSDDTTLYDKYWPADIHLVGKEIVRFHTVIWPILLKMLDLPLPKKIFGHGWLVLEGGVKMSKSKGNVIDPVVLCDRYGTDAIRYFLMRETPFGSDGMFSNEALLSRINSDLANDLGNLLSRTVAMIEKYERSLVPVCGELTSLESDIAALTAALPAVVEAHMNKLQFSLALAEIWKLVGAANRYIDLTQPWTLVKTEEGKLRLKTVLYTLAEACRVIAILVGPTMPSVPARVFEQLGVTNEALKTWDSVAFGRLPSGIKVAKGAALFPRIDIVKDLGELEALLPAKTTAESAPAPAPSPAKQAKPEGVALISIDEFFKTQLKVARVTEAAEVEKSDKLLKLTLSVGDETRTVVSGIAKWYSPDQMIGKLVVLVANLQPAKLRGVLSEGMILCASDDKGNLRLVTPDGDIQSGSEVG